MELLSLVGTGVTLLLAGFNAAIFVVIKFNDLRHLENSVKELVETLKETNKTLMNNGERLATLEGRCKANHG
jgi:hypothetical protein